MSTKPIIFSEAMVKALIDGRKTQTRRIVKPQPSEKALIPRDWSGATGSNPNAIYGDGLAWGNVPMADGSWGDVRCPYGEPGGLLWVREAFRSSRVDGMPSEFVIYRADHPGETTVPNSYGRPWKPSIHMPRWASRITLELTGVRVERLQDISEENARAEGAFFTDYGRNCFHYGAPQDVGLCPGLDDHHPQRAGWSCVPTESHEQCLHSARMAFANLWESIHGPGSWEQNPWAWVLELKPIMQNIDALLRAA